MLVQSRLTRIAVAATGALAMTAPLAHAMPADPIGAPGATAVESQSTAIGVSDAAQRTAGETTQPSSGETTLASVGSDAAQRTAGETNVVVRSSDRSDAAQQVPGATNDVGIVRVTHPVPEPSTGPQVDDGFPWDTVAIAGGTFAALLLAAGGALTLRPRRPAQV